MGNYINSIGVRMPNTGRVRVAGADQTTRRTVATQGSFQRAADLPETRQWKCSNCGHPNVESNVVCGGCSEERDMRTVEPREVA